MYKKIVIAMILVLVLSVFAPANKPGRMQALEAEIESLKSRVETLELETSCMESYINFILSDEYMDMVCDYYSYEY